MDNKPAKKLDRKNAKVLVAICTVLTVGSFSLIAALKVATDLGLIN